MGSLSRDHHNRNLLDQLDELRRRLDGLERSALRGVIGPYVDAEGITATGYLNLLIHENGMPVPYRLAIADIHCSNPVDVVGVIPVGGIIMWSGSVNDIPSRWALCDGNNSTPDLRGMFVIGAGGAYNPGVTGGAATVDASHAHGVGTLDAAAEAAHTHGAGTFITDNDTHSHTVSTLTASNDTHAHGHNLTSGAGSAHSHGIVAGSGILSGSNLSTTTGTESSHTHLVTGNSAEYTHNHTLTGTVANDTHQHDVQGTSGAGSSHDHALSGSVATGGNAAEPNLPPYYALCFIMRTS